MERPNGRIEQAQDEYDYEMTQLQSDTIALADELLKRKPENSPLTFVDICLEGDSSELLEELRQSPLSDLLSALNEQLAIESDGSYYPVLDVRKENGTLTGIGLRVLGWDEDKIRWVNPNRTSREYKRYPGQKDKMREIEIGISYRIGEETVVETLSLHCATHTRGYASISSRLYMPAYAETGYEGHGGKSRGRTSEEDVYWFLDFVARHVGDQPKSIGELQAEQIQTIRSNAERYGVLESVDKLISDTWNAQALYLMNLPCRLLDGNISIAKGLESADVAVRDGEAARLLAKQYKKKRMDPSAGGEWIVSRRYGDN